MEKIGQPRWKSVEYSTSQIKKAGSIIRSADEKSENWSNAIDVTDNWRASHAYPMHIIYTHLRAMANNREDIIVAERLKRLNSIIQKLSREPSMNLWTMQDLEGCRFIVPTLDEVYIYVGVPRKVVQFQCEKSESIVPISRMISGKFGWWQVC